MIRFQPWRLLSAAVIGALSLAAWEVVAIVLDDWRQAGDQFDDWSVIATFDAALEPSIGGRAAQVRRWAADNTVLIKLLVVYIGAVLTLNELRKFIRFGPRASRRGTWNPAEPLIQWSKSAAWTIQDSFENTLIVGATGCGKTSGSLRATALAMLQAGYGALILLAKDDRAFWESLCKEAGRERDLQIFGRNHLRFNFLDYELNRAGAGAGLTENIVKLLSTLLELSERSTGQGGREDDGYWRRACRQLSRNLVDLLALSVGKISVPDLHRLVISAPTSMEQVRSPEWRSGSFCFQCLSEADSRQLAPRQRRDLEIVADYFLVEWPALSDKTRSVILSTFTSMIDVLGRGLLRDLFCGETNITPEATENGAILLIDLPIKQCGEPGLFSQSIWKYCWQIAIERRDVNKSPRPVALFADEAQFVVTSYDMQFLSTCRSSRAAAIYVTQNISNFYGALGGEQKGKAEADSIFGNLNTKIFHANSCPVTNRWASEMIGRTRQFFTNSSSGSQGDWVAEMMGFERSASSAGMSEHLELEVEPSFFSTLRTGGESNQWQVDSLVFKSGQVFPDTGRPWRLATFSQRS